MSIPKKECDRFELLEEFEVRVFGGKSPAAADSVDAAWLCKTREVSFCE
jgi:hypothetical protein